MNKSELIDRVSEGAGTSKAVANSVVDQVLKAVVETVADGDKVTLVGFGTFEPRARKERGGRNPRTGEAVIIPATTVPAFSPGKSFKQAVAPSSAAS